MLLMRCVGRLKITFIIGSFVACVMWGCVFSSCRRWCLGLAFCVDDGKIFTQRCAFDRIIAEFIHVAHKRGIVNLRVALYCYRHLYRFDTPTNHSTNQPTNQPVSQPGCGVRAPYYITAENHNTSVLLSLLSIPSKCSIASSAQTIDSTRRKSQFICVRCVHFDLWLCFHVTCWFSSATLSRSMRIIVSYSHSWIPFHCDKR